MPGGKPWPMPPECSPAKPSCAPGAFNSRGSTGPISIVPGCPRECSRLILRARSENLCGCKKLVDAFRKPVRCFIQEAQESSGALTRKKNEYYRYQKGNRGNGGNH